MCDLSADLRVRVRLALLDLSGDRPPLPRAGGDGLREDEDEELRAEGKFLTECLH